MRGNKALNWWKKGFFRCRQFFIITVFGLEAKISWKSSVCDVFFLFLFSRAKRTALPCFQHWMILRLSQIWNWTNFEFFFSNWSWASEKNYSIYKLLKDNNLAFICQSWQFLQKHLIFLPTLSNFVKKMLKLARKDKFFYDVCKHNFLKTWLIKKAQHALLKKIFTIELIVWFSKKIANEIFVKKWLKNFSIKYQIIFENMNKTFQINQNFFFRYFFFPLFLFFNNTW